METLAVLDCRGTDYRHQLIRAAETKKNFIAFFERAEQVVEACDVLGDFEKPPERLGRWTINALLEALSENDLRKLREEHERTAIYLFEQLFMGRNKPPRTGHFLVYCEVLGIISEHEAYDDAMRALLDYIGSFHRARLLPLAGIYRFENEKWIKHRGGL